MKNLVLTRIDDRLIHGQVMTAWIKNKNAEQVVIIDDGVAQDDFMINVLENAVPDDIGIGIFSKEDGVTFFSRPLEAATIILAKTPQVLEYMIDRGINITEIDLGGMGAKGDRESLYHTISTNKEENDSFKRLIEKDIDTFIQIMPQNDKVYLRKILK